MNSQVWIGRSMFYVDFLLLWTNQTVCPTTPAIVIPTRPVITGFTPIDATSKEAVSISSNAPVDEFGVKHLNLIYSEDEDRMYCFLEAPDKESIKKHHDKFGYNCDYILEVDDTADY